MIRRTMSSFTSLLKRLGSTILKKTKHSACFCRPIRMSPWMSPSSSEGSATRPSLATAISGSAAVGARVTDQQVVGDPNSLPTLYLLPAISDPKSRIDVIRLTLEGPIPRPVFVHFHPNTHSIGCMARVSGSSGAGLHSRRLLSRKERMGLHRIIRAVRVWVHHKNELAEIFCDRHHGLL